MRPIHEPKPGERLEIGVLYGFRALMALFVANYHIWQQGWLPQYFTLFGRQVDFDFFTRSGYLFVDGLILLSGFLLYLPYARQRLEGTPVAGTGRFYFNRLIRIVPSYLFSVAIALLCFALPQQAFATPDAMRRDVLAHLTFTFPFWRETYLFTPLNGVLWTVAIEMQFYLIFPLLAKAAQKRPLPTFSLMAAAGLAYRACVARYAPDTAMLINQLPAFLDVYALGMMGAIAFCHIRRLFAEADARQRTLVRISAALAFVGGVCAVLLLLRLQSQASLSGFEALRLSQMRVRLPLAAALLGCMLGAAYLPELAQRLLNNRLMRFLSAISFNLYIWHQLLAVQMRGAWFPDTLHSDPGLQRAYTALCFCASIVAAMLVTFGLEQPVTRLANKGIEKLERKKKHERSALGKAEPPTDTLLVRVEEGRKGTD